MTDAKQLVWRSVPGQAGFTTIRDVEMLQTIFRGQLIITLAHDDSIIVHAEDSGVLYLLKLFCERSLNRLRAEQVQLSEL